MKISTPKQVFFSKQIIVEDTPVAGVYSSIFFTFQCLLKQVKYEDYSLVVLWSSTYATSYTDGNIYCRCLTRQALINHVKSDIQKRLYPQYDAMVVEFVYHYLAI